MIPSPGKSDNTLESKGEAWREKASEHTMVVTCIMLGRAATYFHGCLLKMSGSPSTSWYRPIAFSRKGLPSLSVDHK